MGCWGRWVLLPKLLSLRAVPWGGGILGLPWRQKLLAAPVPSPVTLQAHKTPSPGSLTRNRTAWGRDGDVCYVWGARKSVSHERVQIGEENTEPGKANQQVVLKTEREVRPESEQIARSRLWDVPGLLLCSPEAALSVLRSYPTPQKSCFTLFKLERQSFSFAEDKSDCQVYGILVWMCWQIFFLHRIFLRKWNWEHHAP